ncbi:MAG TPA: glycosyltransferase family 2 protein [Thermoanaerobaculia bacterium]|nr:glycosyltransferase family 2 protein [Thermoanaerobaculia bacterium]
MISLVVPVHNEEPVLSLLLDRIRSASQAWGEDHELVFVDDGSTDRSLAILMDAAERDSRIRVIKLSRNFGHQAAITAGIQLATGDAVVTLDADLQDPPEEIPRLLEKWREGYQVVYGIRTGREESLPKRAAYAMFYRALHSISDVEIPLDSGDFCLLDRKVVDALNVLPERVRFVRGLRAYVGFKQTGVAYKRAARAAGTPSYTFRGLIELAIDGLFGFSMVPLRLASYLGFVIAIPSFLAGLYFIIHRLFNFPVFGHRATETPGLAALAVGLFFLGGLILIILGIIGEYLGRIYIEVKHRPPYIVDFVHSAGNRPDSATR